MDSPPRPTQESLVYLSLGSNLGDRRRNLVEALREIDRSPNAVVRCSALYETEPVDVREQPPFLNLVCALSCRQRPEGLLATCRRTERALGRRQTFPKGPRVIDIDILFFDDRLIETPRLVVPHPRLQDRRFVLVPLAEIAAEFCDPRSQETVASLLESCPDRSWVRDAGPIRWRSAADDAQRG